MIKLFFLPAIFLFFACTTSFESPTVLRNFEKPASSQEVLDFSNRTALHSDNLHYKSIGLSEGGTELASIRFFSAHTLAEEHLRVLIFAQQHGNEQSGKEAAMLLLRDLAEGVYDSWLGKLEIVVVPQLNPDGSDQNQRRNAGGIDLNRDHIVQLAPETRALHQLFREFNPHVTIDIHEYYPFRESWAEFGGYKNFDVQVGVPTNINVSQELRMFGLHQALPYIENHLNGKGFSFHNYLVGPAPNLGRTRHSTVDFDDGRQSFGILNTLSFIYEGINGPDGYTENLERRTLGQYEALVALLEFLNQQPLEIKNMVEAARKELVFAEAGEKVAIRLEHFPDGNKLMLPLTSVHTGQDTVVGVEKYHPVVQATLEKERPSAYLIPKKDEALVNFLHLHNIHFSDAQKSDQSKAIQYFINRIEVSEDEELSNRFPGVTEKEVTSDILWEDYLLVTTAQLHSNFLVSVFEPQSMLGLAQRPGFEYLLEEEKPFSILRLE